MIPFQPGAPDVNGMSPRDEVVSGMLILNALSMPFRGMDEAFRLACDTDVTRPACENVAEKVDALFQMVPEPMRTTIFQEAQKVKVAVSTGLFREHQIPFEDTEYALESASIIVEGSALMAVGSLVGKAAASVYKQGKRLAKGATNSKAIPQASGLFNNVKKVKPGSEGTKQIFLRENGVNAELVIDYSFTPDRILKIYVQYLRAYTKNGSLAQYGTATATRGAVFQAFRRIANTSSQLMSKEVNIQWFPANSRLLELASKSKWLKFIGDKPYILHSTESMFDNFLMPTFKLIPPIKKLPAGNLATGMSPRLNVRVLPFAAASLHGFNKLPRRGEDVAPFSDDDEQNEHMQMIQPAKRTSLIRQVAGFDSSKRIPGAMLLEKIDEALPAELEVGIENPTHLNKLIVRVMHPIGDEDCMAGVAFTPKNPKNVTILLSKKVDPSTSVGVGIIPLNPTKSTLSITTTVEKVGVGYSFPIQKPLKGQINVTAPLTVYGVPFVFGTTISLKKPLDSHAKLSFPLPGIQITVLSLSPKSVSHGASRVVKSVAHSVRGLFGKKRKKKRHRPVEAPPPPPPPPRNDVIVACEKLFDASIESIDATNKLRIAAAELQKNSEILSEKFQELTAAKEKLEIEHALLNETVQVIIDGPSLSVLTEKIEAHVEGLAMQHSQLQQKIPDLTALLKNKISPEQARRLRDTLN